MHALHRAGSRERVARRPRVYVRIATLVWHGGDGQSTARGEWPQRHGRHAIDARPTAASTLQGVSTASITTILLKKGLRNVWMRGPRPLAPGQGRLVGPRLHAAVRAGARGSGDARNPGPRRARPGPRSRRCRRAASRSSTPWASPTPGSSATSCAGGCTSAAGGGAGHRRGAARSRRHPRRGPAGLVQRDRGAALGRRPDLRRLAGADRLRRRRRVPRRRDRGRRGRCGGDPGRLAGRGAGGRAGAGALRGLGGGRGRARRRRLPGLYPPNAETKARYEAFRASR